MLIRGDARAIPLRDESVQMAVTSPPYWCLRDYGIPSRVWGSVDCPHEWGTTVAVNATNHTDKRRWNHTRNGRDEEQPAEKRVGWLRTVVDQGVFCVRCGAWRGDLGLEPTPELYTEHIVDVFREVRRVLKPDGVCWLNLGDCYATCAGKVGDHPGGGEQGARWKGGPPSEKSTLRGNGHVGGGPKLKSLPPVRGFRGDRAGHEGKHAYRPSQIGPMTQPNRMPIAGLKPKDLVGIPWRVAFALQADGWYLRSDVIWSKPNPMPESVTDRPTKAHEYLFLLAKSERYFYDHEAIKEPYAQSPSHVKRSIIAGARKAKNEQSGDRRKVGFNDRWDTKKASNLRANAMEAPDYDLRNGVGRNKRSVWTITTQPYRGAHFAVMPEDLVEPCILAGSRPGDLVLDPFIGSGTVGVVADHLMRRWVGIDLNYHQLSSARTDQRGLRFSEAPHA